MKKLIFISFFSILLIYNLNGQNFLEVTQSSSGQTVNLSDDQVLEIKLPGNPSSGYSWYASDLSKGVIKQIGSRDFIPDPSNNIVGQSGTEIIRFVGLSQGVSNLTIEYKRIWENDQAAVDNFTITIVSNGKYIGSYIPVELQPINEYKPSLTPKSLPSSFSWQSQCTPVKNQGQCGSCWAFAGCGTLEANIKIKDNVTKDLSEQWLVNCATDMYGCNGGWCPHEYWQTPGAVYESDEPYSGLDEACQSSYTYHEYIDNYGEVDYNGSPTDAEIKQAIYDYGPVWVGVCVGSNFQSYNSGILTLNDYGEINHAVVLVGWDDNNGCWILRNSWGIGWGESGYMRIGYGVSQIGVYASYIVYKGGISHDSPPVANFEASTTSSCSGAIQFTDLSSNNPSSWQWDFGDGVTSNLQSPKHLYATSGIYSVSLIATNGFGTDAITKNSYIEIDLETAPTTTGASSNGPGSVILSASGNGILNWYDTPDGLNLIDTGSTYTTPVLSTNTTYYVQSEITQPIDYVGKTDNTGSGGYYTSTSYWALVFDVVSPIKLVSVIVYANSSGYRTIRLQNSLGVVLDSAVINIPNGQQTITLNFDIPAGSGYMLGTYGSNNLFRNSSGGVYPYTISDIVSITGNTAGSTATNYYYYFYNWEIEPSSCLSPFSPVTAIINLVTGLNENSESNFEIYPNPNFGSFDISLGNQYFKDATLSIINVLGKVLMEQKINNSNQHIDTYNLSQGMYYVKLQTKKSTYLKKVFINKR